MPLRHDGRRVAAITGGTHGIGKAAAELFYRNGWKVYICGSNKEDQRGPQMEREMPGLSYRLADVSDEDAVREFFQLVSERSGGIDAAFNNAGVGCAPRALHLADLWETRRVIGVNLIGTLLCMKYEIQMMLKCQTSGVIVNCSSISALRAATGADSSYAASKAGIIALTREAAADPLYRDRIWFYTLVPGYIRTRMTAADPQRLWEERLPSGRAGVPSEPANLVYELASHPFLPSGQSVFSDGGANLI